jgi:hypothetical protein
MLLPSSNELEVMAGMGVSCAREAVKSIAGTYPFRPLLRHVDISALSSLGRPKCLRGAAQLHNTEPLPLSPQTPAAQIIYRMKILLINVII